MYRSCLPIDTWIAAFLNWPCNVVAYDVKSGDIRHVSANLNKLNVRIVMEYILEKVELLLWVSWRKHERFTRRRATMHFGVSNRLAIQRLAAQIH